MSLKAYDGMMTRKGLKYIQDETIKRIPKFREAAVNKLLNQYAEVIVKAVDYKESVEQIVNHVFGCDNRTSLELKNIKNDNMSLISLVRQISNIMSKSFFINDYTVSLHLSLEAKRGKTLVYPSINVPEYKDILLEYLEDWYAQNQCDKPDNVDAKEWRRRCRDWWKFNEVEGFQFRIHLFHPESFDSINYDLNGQEMISGILSRIPTYEKRLKTIAKSELSQIELKRNNEEDMSVSKIMKLMAYFKTDEGEKMINDYISSNYLTVTKIDEKLLQDKNWFSSVKTNI